MRDGTQKPLATAHLDRADDGVGSSNRDRPAVEPPNRPAVQLSQQIGNVLSDEIDQWRRGAERFAIGERAALHHRFGRELDIPPSRFSEGSHIGGHVFGRLVRRGRVGGLSRARHRVCRSDVRAGCHDGNVGGYGQDESR